MPTPVYSHGGASQAGFPAVPGTSTNAGRPVAIVQANQTDPCMQIFFVGTSCTVLLEGNGGQIDSTGNPPSGEWIDYSNGGYALTTGQTLSKFIPRCVPYWRTRITAIVAGTLQSYCPSIIGPSGVVVSASYPKLDSGPQSYT